METKYGHSRVGYSQASRYVPCPGSVQMQEQFPGQDNDDPEEGNAAHRIAAVWLNTLKVNGPICKSGIDPEMAEYVDLYVTDVITTIETRKLQRSRLLVEHTTVAPNVHSELWGTLDAAILDTPNNELILWELKYGWGLVDEKDNLQAIANALGLKNLYGPVMPEKITFRLVQPRPYCPRGRVRAWTFFRSSLQQHEDRIRWAILEALSTNPRCVAGPHCKNCTALLNCNTAMVHLYSVLETAMAGRTLNQSPTEIGNELRLLSYAKEAIDHRFQIASERAIEKIKRGSVVPGWAIEPSKGKTVWRIPDSSIKALGSMFGVDLETRAVCTPNQAKIKGIPWEVIDPYTQKKQKMQLTIDDGRKAKEVFGNG